MKKKITSCISRVSWKEDDGKKYATNFKQKFDMFNFSLICVNKY